MFVKLPVNGTVCTRFDLLKPDTASHMAKKQSQQKVAHDHHAKPPEFHVGQSVMVKNFCHGLQLIPVTIVHRLGPLSFLIKTQDGQTWRRHMDHVKEVIVTSEPQSDNWELRSFKCNSTIVFTPFLHSTQVCKRSQPSLLRTRVLNW